MQRSITYKNPLSPFLYVIAFVTYESLTGIYLFLPPLFGVLLYLFSSALKKEDSLTIILISICLLFFESENGYLLFTSIIYFLIVIKLIMPKIIQSFNCNSCIKVSYVVLAYLGYFIFYMLISNIFVFAEPSINYYIAYYIIIEFFIVSIL